MKKYNILIVTNGFPYGDSERSFLLEEFIRLQEKFNVTIIAYTQENSIKNSFKWDSKVYKDCWKRRKRDIVTSFFNKDVLYEIKEGYISQGIKKHIKRTRRIISYNAHAIYCQVTLQDIVKKHNINLIYTYWCTCATLAAVRLKEKNVNLKVVSRFHGYDLYNHREPCHWQPFRKEISLKADKLYFVCKRGKEYFCQKWCDDVSMEKCEVAYLGTGKRDKIIEHNKNILSLVSCSNVIPIKRVNLIIEALALIPEKYYIKWIHIGDGELMEDIKLMAENLLGKKNNIKWSFMGQIPNNEIEKIYKKERADLFITTSSSEGSPVSIAEALSMGIPVIGTDVGGISDLINNELGATGYLLNSNPSAKEISDVICNYIQISNEKKNNYRDNAIALWRSKFNSEDNARKFVAGLCEILNK